MSEAPAIEEKPLKKDDRVEHTVDGWRGTVLGHHTSEAYVVVQRDSDGGKGPVLRTLLKRTVRANLEASGNPEPLLFEKRVQQAFGAIDHVRDEAEKLFKTLTDEIARCRSVITQRDEALIEMTRRYNEVEMQRRALLTKRDEDFVEYEAKVAALTALHAGPPAKTSILDATDLVIVRREKHQLTQYLCKAPGVQWTPDKNFAQHFGHYDAAKNSFDVLPSTHLVTIEVPE